MAGVTIAAPPAPHRLPEGSFEFRAAHGGPFFELQQRLKLLRDSSLNTGRRALLFVALAWGMPLLLTLPRVFSGEPALADYLSDPGPWTRFLLGIGAFVLAEQQVEKGLQHKLRQFVAAPLIAPASMASAASAVAHALRQRDSGTAEGVCFVLASLSAILAYLTLVQASGSTWAAVVSPDGTRLTLAGWWCVCVSVPMFIFLFLRGCWRHLIWANLLRRIARLDLRLVATHPDGKGGLSFLGEYPNAYMLFVFGVSSGLAAAITKHMIAGSLSTATLTTVMAGWLLIVIAFFAYPLSAFSKPLSKLKNAALQTLSAGSTVQQRAAERRSTGTNAAAFDPEEAQQAVEPLELTKQYEQTRKLSVILISRGVIVPVAAAALLPFSVAGASRLPYKEVFAVVKKLLLI